MAFEDRSYSGNASTATLTSSITNLTTAIPISTSTGWPDGTGGPFHVGVAPANDPDNYTEVIRCTSRTGLTLNVQTVPVNGRGWDGTTAASHAINSVIRPVFTATDADEANQHYANTGLDHHSQYLNVARHDLAARHGIANLPVGGTPSTNVVGDTAQVGTSGTLSRSDHKHARESFGSPVAAGYALADGAAVTLPRSDHVHSGGIQVVTSATRPASPSTGMTIIESDTRRMVMYTGTRWQRGSWFSSTGRTATAVLRANVYSIPNGGASSHIIPWDTEVADTDGYIPAPDGTTTNTITIPTLETTGMYVVSMMGAWAALTSVRAFAEIIHNNGGNLFYYRTAHTGEDVFSMTAFVDMALNDTVQVGVWQNTGAALNIEYMHLYVIRIGP